MFHMSASGAANFYNTLFLISIVLIVAILARHVTGGLDDMAHTH